MRLRPLGQTGIMVPPICLGTMTFGTQNSEQEAHAQLDYALRQGVNFIDTAELYPFPVDATTCHQTEQMIGRWLTKQPRDKIILATKACGPSKRIKWIRGGPNFSAAHLDEALNQSLERLQTDYVDLYQLHWPERTQPLFGEYQFTPPSAMETDNLHEQLAWLDKAVNAGKVRAVGLSNENGWGVMRFLQLAEQHNLVRIASVQNAYSLINRVYDQSLAEINYREQVALLAYSPLAFGYLSGKYMADAAASGRVTLYPKSAGRYTKVNVLPATRAYAQLAHAHDLTPTAMALAWVYHRWSVTSTIIGATTLAQLSENIAAINTTLDADILAEIEAIHLRYTNPAP